MSLSFHSTGVWASFLSAWLFLGCELFAPSSGVPPDVADDPQPLSHPPRHEVFAASLGINSPPTFSVVYPPPQALPELPPETKPDGADVVWVPGYWTWDTHRDNWLWVSGVWVHAPPGRQWTQGYWSVVADGWRWVPGLWAPTPPPPRPAPPPPVIASAPAFGYSNDPSYGYLGGYGMWWPWYWNRPSHNSWREHESALRPLGHVGEPALTLHGPHAANPVPALIPSLASSVHETSLPHVDMASVFASVPKPLFSSSELSREMHDHAGGSHSLFSTSHLESAHHGIFHGSPSAYALGGAKHESVCHASAGHGGGHAH